jgi:hypothetical protein
MPTREPPLEVLLPVFAAVAACCVAGLSVLSRVVNIERERHPAQWEADGRPAAPWIVPWRMPRPGDPSLPANPFDLMRTNLLVLRWMAATPSWAREDAEARRLLWLLRGLQILGLVGVGTWFVLLIPLVGRR